MNRDPKIKTDVPGDADLCEPEEEGELLTFSVPPELVGERLDNFIAAVTAQAMSEGAVSRSQAAKLCTDGRVLVNGRSALKKILMRPADVVELHLPAPVPDRVEPEDIPLDVVYEDGDLIVINKPAGMVVHPAPGHLTGTLCAALLYHCGDSLSGIGGVSRPGIVHRIDKDTTGLLVAAKNDLSHNSLAAQIKEHSAFRTYQALVIGGFAADSGEIDAPIGRHPVERKSMAVVPDGREALTHWRVLERFSGFSLVECRLETGRTHQIRVHMSHTGHPVLGDPLYGGDRNPFFEKHRALFTGQCLHAWRLELTHPRTGKRMRFEREMPENMKRVVELLRDRD